MSSTKKLKLTKYVVQETKGLRDRERTISMSKLIKKAPTAFKKHYLNIIPFFKTDIFVSTQFPEPKQVVREARVGSNQALNLFLLCWKNNSNK